MTPRSGGVHCRLNRCRSAPICADLRLALKAFLLQDPTPCRQSGIWKPGVSDQSALTGPLVSPLGNTNATQHDPPYGDMGVGLHVASAVKLVVPTAGTPHLQGLPGRRPPRVESRPCTILSSEFMKGPGLRDLRAADTRGGRASMRSWPHPELRRLICSAGRWRTSDQAVVTGADVRMEASRR